MNPSTDHYSSVHLGSRVLSDHGAARRVCTSPGVYIEANLKLSGELEKLRQLSLGVDSAKENTVMWMKPSTSKP